MIIQKPFAEQAAFTLIELIITMIIVGILGVYAQSKFSGSSSYDENTAVAQIISSAQLAQQLSMNDSQRDFTLVISDHQIDLQVDGGPQPDGSSFDLENERFPITIKSTVTLTNANIVFNRDGSTSSLTISVVGSSTKQVCFNTSGYIHSC